MIPYDIVLLPVMTSKTIGVPDDITVPDDSFQLSTIVFSRLFSPADSIFQSFCKPPLIGLVEHLHRKPCEFCQKNWGKLQQNFLYPSAISRMAMEVFPYGWRFISMKIAYFYGPFYSTPCLMIPEGDYPIHFSGNFLKNC